MKDEDKGALTLLAVYGLVGAISAWSMASGPL
jgi:hypothetical protein